MRYSSGRPLWRQRKWWQDGLVFALLFPLIVTALGGDGNPLRGSLLGYVLETATALAGWGLIGWVESLRRRESDGETP